MDYILKRLSEPSTYAGIGSVVTGALVLGKAHEAEAVGAAIANSGESFVRGDYIGGGAALIFSLLAIFKGEKS